jgi:Flp pilus assembly protein TadD
MHLSCKTILLILITALSGCDIQNLKPSGSASKDISEIAEISKTAQVAYQNEDWKTAEIAYKKLTEKIPAEPEPWFRLGNIYARTERLDAAVAAYKNALARNPKSSKIWHNLGIVHLRQATNTFIEMLEYTKEDDPLNARAKNVINSVSNLMDSGFETVGKE